MRIAQSISKDEQEWLKEFDELRNKLDEGERVLQAEKRGINIGENKLRFGTMSRFRTTQIPFFFSTQS